MKKRQKKKKNSPSSVDTITLASDSMTYSEYPFGKLAAVMFWKSMIQKCRTPIHNTRKNKFQSLSFYSWTFTLSNKWLNKIKTKQQCRIFKAAILIFSRDKTILHPMTRKCQNTHITFQQTPHFLGWDFVN